MEELDRLDALCQAATPGPWTLRKEWDDFDDSDTIVVADDHGSDYMEIPNNDTDAEFIAAARSALPALIVAIHETRTEISKAWESLDDEELSAGESLAEVVRRVVETKATLATMVLIWSSRATDAADLHFEGDDERNDRPSGQCVECDRPWPCGTVRAITGEPE